LAYQSLDEDGCLLDVNPAWLRTLGYEREEVIGKRYADFLHPDWKPHLEKNYPEFKRCGLVHDVQHRVKHKDGYYLDILLEGIIGYWPDGSFRQSYCVFQDVTERKQAEEELRASEKRFQDVAMCSVDWVWEVDASGTYTLVSGNVRQILGYEPDELIGKTPFELMSKDEAKRIGKFFNRIASEKKPIVDLENWNLTKDGKRVCFLTNGVPILDEQGNLVGYRGVDKDITEHKQAAEAIRESENRYQELFSSVMEGIGIVDENKIIKYCNPALVEIFEEDSASNLVGKNLLDYIPESQREAVLLETENRRKGESSQYELQIMTSKGRKKIILVSATPRFDNSNDYIGGFGTVLDITETKRLQALESRAARLETAGTIAGQVAHDFNNLLAPIMAYPEFIHDELSHDNKAHAYIDAIEDAANKMAVINQDLLTMGRRGHYNQEVFDLNRVVLQAAQEMESRTKTVTVERDLCEDLMNIKGGAAQVHRLLTNLFVNAKDAMDDMGQITIRTENYYADDTSIAFGRVPRGEYVKLTVSDNGCGIPDDIIQKILDPFFSTKTANKKRGSGLGLSVVDAVMKDHSGYLDLSSKVGQGTSFYLYFPVSREDSGESETKQLAGGTERVLVVDDDDIQREVSSRLLKKLGYEVSSIESGEKAVEYIRENPQDIIILDMVMPGGMDGTETYRQVLEVSPQQKAIILSGFSESDRVMEVQKLGAGAFVRKPITKTTIAAAVRIELDREVEVLSS